MNKSTTTSKSAKAIKTTRTTSRARRRAIWKAIGTVLTSRSRDIALLAIVIGAFVAVFDGSLYSATTFSFHGWSAYAFAVMPDALMVLSAAKMRQVGITAAQHEVARKWMMIALRFSLLTNMIAAFLRNAPQEWITAEVLLIGAVAYHGMIVVFLKGAVDVLTTTRADRNAKAHKAPGAAVTVAAPVASTPKLWIKPASWADTALAALIGSRRSA